MFDSDENPTTTDIARVMKRLGFSQEEIYDTLTGAGIPGTDAQLLLDRIDDEFEDVEYESKVSRVGEEVKDIFEAELDVLRIKLDSRIRTFEKNIASLEGKVENLEKQISKLHKRREK